MNNLSSVSRRSVATGLAWSVPTIAAASALPAFAVSKPLDCLTPNWYQIGRGAAQPCAAFTGSFTAANGTSYTGNGGVDWNNAVAPTGTTVTSSITSTTMGPVDLTVSTNTVQGNTSSVWSSGTSNNLAGCGTTRSCTVPGVAPSYPNFGCTRNGTVSIGAPDSFANNGVGLNMSLVGDGTTSPIQQITFTFSQPVCGFMIRLRDLSWYDGTVNTTAAGRDAVYFSQAPSTIIDDGPGTNMSGYLGTGASQDTALRRVVKGSEPINGTGTTSYSDMMLVFGPISGSLTMTYFNASETDSATGMAVPAPLPSGKVGFMQLRFARILI